MRNLPCGEASGIVLFVMRDSDLGAEEGGGLLTCGYRTAVNRLVNNVSVERSVATFGTCSINRCRYLGSIRNSSFLPRHGFSSDCHQHRIRFVELVAIDPARSRRAYVAPRQDVVVGDIALEQGIVGGGG